MRRQVAAREVASGQVAPWEVALPAPAQGEGDGAQDGRAAGTDVPQEQESQEGADHGRMVTERRRPWPSPVLPPSCKSLAELAAKLVDTRLQ
jgi:hypothetical protein